ncbi:hypothetical protein KAFR_0D02900 [Kazachstania africana CBS 2517]|uniref:[RNA-polymerase]-subunit kinase n=1 Tax=Kazachstania africana (strain ATCC 22294 / BCRC 22015 / CBS 2517 / CECT 1963 / NBRC 1671 / NRRL Y-8276) TaxID=1071382 RepID=H2AU88_KAZAF|nr:hypothetical protein KAFR_0D02900 [Kazachstania africana CBS 2517]CCF57938.1 hypothetical protein KAFR_0D02900 [Kazachstania africana CBS 2517]
MAGANELAKRIRSNDAYDNEKPVNNNNKRAYQASRYNGSHSINNGGANHNKRTRSRYEGSTPSSRYNSNTNTNINTNKSSSNNNNIKANNPMISQQRFDRLLPKGPKASRYEKKSLPSAPRPKIPKKDAIIPSFLQQKRKSSVYDRILQVGEGTYGKVYKAKNNNSNELVALKKLRLNNEREGFPITSIREIKLLQSFNHDNVSTIREIMVENSKVVYMIFEYADNDLSGLLLNKSIEISDSQKKHIFRQLLSGLNYLHKNNVIHRDIKGSNILVNNKGNLKITDFGLARKIPSISKNDQNDYTNRVITLWYRPPELLLGTTNYSYEVDMWGCGCLLMELYNSTAIFQGSSEIEQIVSIFKILGMPTLENLPNLFKMPWFFMVMPLIKEQYTNSFRAKFRDLLPSEECFDLARGLLLYDQSKRLTAEEALKSAYFTEDPKPEPLILENNDESSGGCHEFEVKLARKQQKERERQREKGRMSSKSTS